MESFYASSWLTCLFMNQAVTKFILITNNLFTRSICVFYFLFIRRLKCTRMWLCRGQHDSYCGEIGHNEPRGEDTVDREFVVNSVLTPLSFVSNLVTFDIQSSKRSLFHLSVLSVPPASKVSEYPAGSCYIQNCTNSRYQNKKFISFRVDFIYT